MNKKRKHNFSLVGNFRHIHSRVIATILLSLEKLLYDPKIRNILKRELNNPGLIIFDIGANRGQFIDLLSFVKDSEIHAFEPNPEVFRILSEKFNDTDATLNNYGVGNIDGYLPFHKGVLDETSTFLLPDPTSTYHRKKSRILLTNPNKMYQKIDVKTMTLDTYCRENQITSIDLLKIDVEGFEREVLEGARSLFEKRAIKRLQIESHEDDMRPNQDAYISEYLTNFDFFKKHAIRHSFGNFFDNFWVIKE